MQLPRFRSRDRDINTDIARVQPLYNAAAKALREAQAEMAGLRNRLDDASTRAAFFFGNELESATMRSPDEESRLKSAEELLTRGQLRMRYLERQVASLGRIVAELEGIASPHQGAQSASAATK